MSYRNSAPNDTEANGPLEFIKTVVSDGTRADRNSTDSDKENDHRLMTISEESTETKSSAEGLKEQVQGHLRQSENPRDFENKHNPMMAKDEENDIIDMWEDFHNEEDLKEGKKESGHSNGIRETDHTTRFEIENRVLDKVEEEREESQADDYSSIFDSSVKEDEGDHNEGEAHTGENIKKRHRRKRLFKRRLHSTMVSTSQTTGGSHPDLGHRDTSHQSNQLETMSESGGAGDRGRRLSRRKQVSRPRCAGPAPSGDVLQQKYQELEQLVLKPLPNPAGYVKQTRQQMLRLQGLGSQYHASNHSGNNQLVDGLPPPSGNPRDEDRRPNQVNVEEIFSDQGYSTIRTVQVVQGGTSSYNFTRHNHPKTAHPSRRPNFGLRKVRPISARRERPASANHQLRENTETVNVNSHGRRGRGVQRSGINRGRGGQNLRGSGEGSCRSDSENKDHSSHDSQDSHNASSDNRNRSNSRSPSRTDTQLKHNSNPEIREWLKSKNKLERHQKLEERKKKREERAEKQEHERTKQEYFQDSEKRVKEWMVKKRKEAWRRAKEEEKKAQQEEMERFERQEQNQYTGSLRGHSLERPQSAPSHSDRKIFIPVIRPDGDHATNDNAKDQCNGQTPSPQPPKSKFVYKRPVSGRVRLMKLQQERKEGSKKLEMKEMEVLTEEEKNRKMRMSYDQWLIKKRQEGYEKRQTAARQRALAKSDPELERIVPEIARRRIENIQRGKKPIRTSIDSIDETVNKSFGGGDFGEEHTSQNGVTQETPGLQVSGQKKSLGQRPSSAKPPSTSSPLNPQMSRSPRRPKSAHPRVQSCMDSNEGEQAVEAKAFQLPFPPELGVPKYVAERQGKLFSAEVVTKASTDASLLSTDAKMEDSESHKNSVDAQENKSENTKISGDSQQVHPESERFEPQGSTSPLEGLEIPEASTIEQCEEDPSFFVTDGNIEAVDKIVCKEKEATLEEILKDEDMNEEDQENLESSKYSNKLESDDNVNEAEMEFVEDEDEQKNTSENEEEANKTHDDQKDNENLGEDKVEDTTTTSDLFGEENETEENQVPNVEFENENSADGKEQHKDDEAAPQILENGSETNDSDTASGTLDKATKAEIEKELKNETDQEEEPKSEASESKSSTKHVSFVEEAVIHEDPLAGIPHEDYETDTGDDEAEDERGDFFGEGSPRNGEASWNGQQEQGELDDDEDEDYF